MSPLAQIWLIARMEIRRAFFSRRALWVYLLALFPAVLFLGHGLSIELKLKNWTAKGITPAPVLDGFTTGQTAEEVLALASNPVTRARWEHRPRNQKRAQETEDQPQSHGRITYFDGRREVTLLFQDDRIKSIHRNTLRGFEEDRRIYAGVFQYFYLRLAIFFGCLGIFINLFRGELLDKSLHFWFLAPVRRDVLLLGKYSAGLIASSVIFCSGALLSFAALVVFQDVAERQAYLQGDGWSHAFWYIAAAALGCVGYGSVFLVSGLILRNPIVPAVVILLWESINGFLPDVLQKLSVLHYLQSICPVPAPMDSNIPPVMRMLLAPAAPSETWVAVGGLLALTAAVLWIATRAVRRLEVNYGTE